MICQTLAEAIAASIPVTDAGLLTLGYNAPFDGGGGEYLRVGSAPATYGKFQNSVDGSWWKLSNRKRRPQMYGGMGGSSFDDVPILAWWSDICVDQVGGEVIARHNCATNLTLDMSIGGAQASGLKIEGSSRQSVGFQMASNKTLSIAPSTGAAFSWKFLDFSVWGSVSNGPVLRLGDDAFQNPLNDVDVTMNVNNGAQNSSARMASEAVRINYHLFSTLDLVANGGGSGNPLYPATSPGYGTAIVMRQSVGNTFLSPGAGNAYCGIQMRDGYNYGNSLVSPDIEEVTDGIRIDVTTARSNVALGGSIVAVHCHVESYKAVPRMQFIATNMSPYSGGAVFWGGQTPAYVSPYPGQYFAGS